MNDKAILENYINHWERILEQWTAATDSQPSHGCQDNPFLRALPGLLCPAYMPEPYWGSPLPDECTGRKASIVFANHNPVCGSRSTNPGHEEAVAWFRNHIAIKGYFSFAKEAPIFMEPAVLSSRGWSGFEDYGGRGWWKGRIKWAQYTAERFGIAEGAFRPFVMELCGWHSPSWPTNAYDRLAAMPDFDGLVRDPLVAAIAESETKIGLFVGKKYSEVFKKAGFKLERGKTIAPLSTDRFDVLSKNGMVAVVTFGARQHAPRKDPFWDQVCSVVRNIQTK